MGVEQILSDFEWARQLTATTTGTIFETTEIQLLMHLDELREAERNAKLVSKDFPLTAVLGLSKPTPPRL